MILGKFTLCLYLVMLLSCQNNASNSQRHDNDTMAILKVTLKEGITSKFMPSASPLKRKWRFGDSILLTSQTLPLNLLPSSVDEQNFKILSQEQICLMIKEDTDISQLPNYLNVKKFEKSDTGYYIQVQSLSCLPFGGGGSLGLYFKKINDSLLIINRTSGSIN
jgi:hypothetical protein